MENYISEVRRVTESPYAVCLKRLHDCLRKFDGHDLQLWAECNGCQIDALAAKVLEGLQAGPYALKIIQCLSCIIEFRDGLLRQEPILLDTLLSRANDSETGYKRYADVCLSMLSIPLPSEVPVPASLPPFMVVTLEMAIRKPSADTIRPLYIILSAMGSGLLEMLSDDAIKRLQENLKYMLRTLGNDFDSLLCLAIFARMATPRPVLSNNSTQLESDTSSEKSCESTQDRYEVARNFLNRKKAAKTLELVILRVVLICSINCPLDFDKAIDSLRLSKEIIDAVDETEKGIWLKKATTGSRKLHEKVLRPDLDPSFRSLALEIVASLSDDNSLPNALVVAFEKILTIPVMIYPSDRSIQKYAVQFDEPSVCAQLLRLLGLGSTNKPLNSYSIASFRSAHTLVRNLTETVKMSCKLRKMILYAVSRNETRARLQLFISAQSSHTNSGTRYAHSELCPRRCLLGFQELQQVICILLLTAAMYASSDEVNMDSATASALLEKQIAFSKGPPGCDVCRSPCQSPVIPQVALFETASTPAATAVSHDWRGRLANILSRGALQQHDHIVQIVGEVCRDLESRCENIERPLREEQNLSDELRHQLEDLRVRYEETENQVQERVLAVDGLEAEKSRLMSEVQALEQRLQSAAETSNNLQETLEQVRQEAQRSEEAARKDERKRELDYVTMLAAKTKLNEQQTSELASQGAQIMSLNHEMNLMRSQVAQQAEEIARFKQAGEDATHTVERVRKLVNSKEAELVLLNNDREAMQSDNENLQLKVKEQVEQYESLSRSTAEQNRLNEAQRAKLVHDHESYIHTKTAEIAQLRESHEEMHRGLRTEHNEANAKLDEVVQRKISEIKELEKKVVKLCSEREERAREFAEVQELSSKLMAVMNSKPTQLGISQASTRSTNQIYEQPSRPQLESREIKLSLGTTRSFGSNISGSTPKRTRPRRQSKTPSTHQPNAKLKFSTTKFAHGSTFKIKRYPLQDLDLDLQNQAPPSPTKHGIASDMQFLTSERANLGEENACTENEVDLSGLSFNESDIFTSTERRASSPPRTRFLGDTDDETTVDL